MATDGQHRGTAETVERAGAPPEQGTEHVTVNVENEGSVDAEAESLAAEVSRLRREVDRREAELETVVDRYERQLTHERRVHADDGQDRRVQVQAVGGRGPARRALGAVRTLVGQLL